MVESKALVCKVAIDELSILEVKKGFCLCRSRGSSDFSHNVGSTSWICEGLLDTTEETLFIFKT